MLQRQMMDEIELELNDIAQGGDGVGRWQGRVVFVRGGLPGERVRVRLSDPGALGMARPFLRGDVLAVLRPATERVAPRLPNADHMSWQHIAYTDQLRFKEAILAEQLAKLAGLHDVTIRRMIPARHPWEYRNTAHFHAQQGRLGYYAAGSREVVDLEEDPLLLPVLNDALHGLRVALAADALRNARLQLEHVTLRASATFGYAIAALQGRGDAEAFASLVADWRAHVPGLAGVAVQTTGRSQRPQSPEERDRAAPPIATTLRPPTLHEELDGVVFVLTVDSFFQVHTAQAVQMIEVVREGLGLRPGERLLDAYSGAGTFALPLARGLSEVIAVEENPQAVSDGKRSATYNAINNVRFVPASVERVLPTLEAPFDAAVLDPPRRGCHPAALAALCALAPSRIAYVSCHPAILARDVRPLLEGGYRLTSVQPIDVFPQTPHIECVAFLTRIEN